MLFLFLGWQYFLWNGKMKRWNVDEIFLWLGWFYVLKVNEIVPKWCARSWCDVMWPGLSWCELWCYVRVCFCWYRPFNVLVKCNASMFYLWLLLNYHIYSVPSWSQNYLKAWGITHMVNLHDLMIFYTYSP